MFNQNDFSCVIVDEAHHVPAQTWRDLLDRFPGTRQIFLTATPYRHDRLPIIADRIYQFSLAEAIRAKYVKNIKFVQARCSQVTIDNWELNGNSRTFNENEILEMRSNPRFASAISRSSDVAQVIIERAIEELREKRSNSNIRHSLLICGRRITQIENLVGICNDLNIRAREIHSHMCRQEIDSRLSDLNNGTIDAILHAGMLGEGYDEQTISIIALTRHFRSFPYYYQMVGRSLRIQQNPTSKIDSVAVVVDHIGFNHDDCIRWLRGEIQTAEILPEDDMIEIIEIDGDVNGTGTGQIIRNAPTVIDLVTPGFEESFLVDPSEMPDIIQAKETIQDIPNPALRTELEKVIEEHIKKRSVPSGMEQRPDILRKRIQQRLDKKIKRVSYHILGHMTLESNGKELLPLVDIDSEKSPSQDNYVATNRAINRKIREAIQVPTHLKGRDQWPLQYLQAAEHTYLLIANEVMYEFCQKLNYSEPYPSLEPPDQYEDEEKEEL